MNQIESNMLFCTLHIRFFLFSSHVQYDCSCKNSDESTYLRGYAADILTGPILKVNSQVCHILLFSKKKSLRYHLRNKKNEYIIIP